MRVSLTDRVSIEARGTVIDEERFPGRQGRLVFAYLLAEQGRPVPRTELADLLWGDMPPATWEKALSVLVSKLRALLTECGLDGAEALKSAFGCYQLTLPADTWVDVAAADEAARAGEHALEAGELDRARAEAATAEALARRAFLPGEEGSWVEAKRAELRETLVRALDCLAVAYRAAGDSSAALRSAEELIALEPYRERGYRLLMEAQSAGGNDAEALRTYERCRRLLADELGAYPSPETEAIYRELLRTPARPTHEAPRKALGPVVDPDSGASSSRRSWRGKAAGVLALLVAVTGAASIALVVASRGDASTEVVPNSLVRIDPDTLEPTKVVAIGDSPDIVVAAGGFVWVTHHVLRTDDTGALRNAGDRILSRVDPSTGDVDVVGGGLAPCGLVADPSGDVWVANCYPSSGGRSANVVQIDATTLEFERTWQVPGGAGFYRGLAYGGGSLWVSDVAGGDEPPERHSITRIDPRTGAQRTIPLDRFAGALAWSEGYGDLWLNHFDAGSISRLDPATEEVETVDGVATYSAFPVVHDGVVWAGDWGGPQVARFRAFGPAVVRKITLPVVNPSAWVWNVAADAGSVWASTPHDHAVWRIDPKTSGVTRIPVPYFPAGLAVDDGGIWVTVRER